jgi:hypothetical protein
MDFRYYKVVKDPETGNVCIVGAMRDPVNWEFRVMMEPEDIGGFAKMFFNWAMLWLVIANAFRYVVYLFNRKQYAEEGEPIEEKVFRAYNTMMRKGRPQAAKTKQGESKKCLNMT